MGPLATWNLPMGRCAIRLKASEARRARAHSKLALPGLLGERCVSSSKRTSPSLRLSDGHGVVILWPQSSFQGQVVSHHSTKEGKQHSPSYPAKTCKTGGEGGGGCEGGRGVGVGVDVRVGVRLGVGLGRQNGVCWIKAPGITAVEGCYVCK